MGESLYARPPTASVPTPQQFLPGEGPLLFPGQCGLVDVKVARVTLIGVAAGAAVWLASLAAADEGITLLAGDTAAVKGTSITCVAQLDAIRCSAPNGTASLSKTGKVVVTRGAHRLFPRSTSSAAAKHYSIGNLEGFFVSGTPIVCHVYVTDSKTMSCATQDAKGGLAGTYGFDLTDKAVVVFRYGKIQDRHDLATYP